MAFTQQQSDAIVAAIKEKTALPGIVGSPLCPICGHNQWSIQSAGLVYLVIQTQPGAGIALGGPSLPSVAIGCTTCGNTQLLNVLVLGLGELFGLVGGEAPKADQPTEPPVPSAAEARP